MNINKHSQIFFYMLLITSSITIATPWGWAKNKIGSIWFSYKTWNIPRPALIGHDLELDRNGKKFEVFRYDLSKDNDSVKQLRKKLQISGIYLSDDSDMVFYRKYVNDRPNYMINAAQRGHVENGFDINNNNTICACMGRLLDYQKRTVRPIMTRDETEPLIQLLWEIENSLPMAFDQDDHGIVFVDFIRKMLNKDIPEVNANEENKEKPFMSIFLSGLSDAFEERSVERKREIVNYLSVWRHYSLRFRNNRGLARAIRELPKS